MLRLTIAAALVVAALVAAALAAAALVAAAAALAAEHARRTSSSRIGAGNAHRARRQRELLEGGVAEVVHEHALDIRLVAPHFAQVHLVPHEQLGRVSGRHALAHEPILGECLGLEDRLARRWHLGPGLAQGLLELVRGGAAAQRRLDLGSHGALEDEEGLLERSRERGLRASCAVEAHELCLAIAQHAA